MLINGNSLPFETSHTSLYLLERPQLLLNFDGSFEQKIGPLYAPNGPWLEIGDWTILIDIQNIYMDVTCKIAKKQHQFKLRDWRRNSVRHTSFCQQTLQSLLSDDTVMAQGVKVSSAKGLYAHMAFIKTEFSHSGSKKYLVAMSGL